MLPLVLLSSREVNVELLCHLLSTVLHLPSMSLSTLLHMLTPSFHGLLRVERPWHWAVHEPVVHGCYPAVVAPHW